ncbi:uncharacterized protein TNIN_53761 [Trichonephila inaurata madagascariensis]|uniref:Uncharacterized protein n=1 Tax=Trichonephila inaurata madagascariensis TaxID=2747483 RepID=A0A8X6XGY6_9ARAC|nr:uncharacterized protein TNIN_53761 [Trichonephila inaurata madagascariensis]
MESESVKSSFSYKSRSSIPNHSDTSKPNTPESDCIRLKNTMEQIQQLENTIGGYDKLLSDPDSESLASTEDEDTIPSEEMKKKMWIQLKKKQEVTDDVLLDDFLPLDSEAEISGSLTESDILNSVKILKSTAMDCNEEDEDNNNTEINKPLYDEMINWFETIRRLSQCEENTPEELFLKPARGKIDKDVVVHTYSCLHFYFFNAAIKLRMSISSASWKDIFQK